MSNVFVGDATTEILLDTGVALATADSVAIKVRKPTGEEETWTGTVSAVTKVRHLLASGDVDVEGTYYLQAYVTWPGGSIRGKTVTLDVKPAFG
jgi:hypothetical protein